MKASGMKELFVKPDTIGVGGGNQYGVARAPKGTTITDAMRGQMGAKVGLVVNPRGLGRRIKGEDEGEFRKRKDLEQAGVEYYLVDPLPVAATREAIQKALAEWGWGVEPTRTTQPHKSARGWIVSAESAPQHNALRRRRSLAVVQHAPPRAPRTLKQRWRGAAEGWKDGRRTGVRNGRWSAERGSKRQDEGGRREWKHVAKWADADPMSGEEVDGQIDALGKTEQMGAPLRERMMPILQGRLTEKVEHIVGEKD